MDIIRQYEHGWNMFHIAQMEDVPDLFHKSEQQFAKEFVTDANRIRFIYYRYNCKAVMVELHHTATNWCPSWRVRNPDTNEVYHTFSFTQAVDYFNFVAGIIPVDKSVNPVPYPPKQEYPLNLLNDAFAGYCMRFEKHRLVSNAAAVADEIIRMRDWSVDKRVEAIDLLYKQGYTPKEVQQKMGYASTGSIYEHRRVAYGLIRQHYKDLLLPEEPAMNHRYPYNLLMKVFKIRKFESPCWAAMPDAKDRIAGMLARFHQIYPVIKDPANILYLSYEIGLTDQVIAERYDTTENYITKVIYKCIHYIRDHSMELFDSYADYIDWCHKNAEKFNWTNTIQYEAMISTEDALIRENKLSGLIQ